MSSNEYLRLHWGERRKKKAGWEVLLRKFGCDAGVTRAEGKRKVKITRYGMHLLDKANLWTPIDKLLIDPMRSRIRKRIGVRLVEVDGLSWIIDDSIKWLEIELEQRKVPRDLQRMVIEIEEA